MSDAWTERLSEYVDGELSGAERVNLETHLAGCDECRRLAEELREVRWRAAVLEDRPPGADLWPGIEARLRAPEAEPDSAVVRSGAAAGSPGGAVDLAARRRPSAGRARFSFPQLAAAALASLLLGGGAVWLAVGGAPGARPAERAGAALTEAVRPAGDASYQSAIRRLELELAAGREGLSPATVRTLETSLATIDRAIEQARRALEEDPANAYLSRHLSQAMTRKVELLRQANALAGT